MNLRPPKAMPETIPLSVRVAAYGEALARAEDASVAYLDARAAGVMPEAVLDEMDAAQAELRRAKRRLEETERRIAKRVATTPRSEDAEQAARRHTGLGGQRLPG